jgi:hypothetical protein
MRRCVCMDVGHKFSAPALLLLLAVGTSSNTHAQGDGHVIYECPHSDIPTLDGLKSSLDRVLAPKVNSPRTGLYYRAAIRYAQTHAAPQLYISGDDAMEVDGFLTDRGPPGEVQELVYDFHLGVMLADRRVLRGVERNYARLAYFQHYDNVPNAQITGGPGFLAPIALLDKLTEAYRAAVDPDPNELEHELESLDQTVQLWLKDASVSSYAQQPEDKGGPSSAQLNSVWLHFHLGVLARFAEREHGRKPARNYFEAAGKYVGAHCQPKLSGALKHLAMGQPACSAQARNAAVVDANQHPYFCRLADQGFSVQPSREDLAQRRRTSPSGRSPP